MPIEFGEIDPDTGEYKHIASIEQDTIKKCPHLIVAPEHYREDGSCKCDDPEHKVMIDWGYLWSQDAKQWQ